MGTKDVRIDDSLNKAVWAHGIKWVWNCSSSSHHKLAHLPFLVFLVSFANETHHRLSFKRNVPFRLRVRLARKRNDDDDAKEKLYTLVSHVPVSSFKG